MTAQYLKFLANGGALGLAAWAIQAVIFSAIGTDTGLAYGIATALTYAPLIVVNYLIQRRWIFRSDGRLWKFVTANLAIMAFVSILSPVCRFLIARVANTDWGNGGGFILAALVGSTLSFFVQRQWVFRETRLA